MDEELKGMVQTAIYKGNNIDAVMKILEIIKRNEESQKEMNQNLLKRIRGLEISNEDVHKSIENIWKEINKLKVDLRSHRNNDYKESEYV